MVCYRFIIGLFVTNLSLICPPRVSPEKLDDMKNLDFSPVHLRTKKIAQGKESIYLDIVKDGIRKKEFIGLYLIPEKTRADKVINRATMKTAEEIRAKRIVELMEGKVGIGKKPDKVDLLEWFEEQRLYYYDNDNMNYSKTIHNLIRHLTIFHPRKLMLSDVKPTFIRKFLEYLRSDGANKFGGRLCDETIYTYFTVFSILMNKAVRLELIISNPFHKLSQAVKPQRRTKKKEYLTLSEVKRMAEAECDDWRVKYAFMFCCFTGLRYIDVSRLKWKHIVEVGEGKYQIELIQQKTKALSSSAVNGLVANNGCNGEIQIVPVVRKKDGKKTFLALQSLPTSGRTNVSIFYKDLTDEATYTTPANFAKDWDGSFVVCDFSSAYSTWSWQHDNALAFLYEEGGGTGGGYNIVYKRIDIPTITNQEYDFDTSYKYERFNIDWAQADLNKEMASLLTTVKKTSEANTSFVKGDKLITDASQLTCKFGHKEMGGTGGDAQDISNLIDGNPATYYHTYYGAGAQPNGSHFMDVTLPEGQTFQGNIEVDVTRCSGATADHITQFTISGWNNNATDTTQIAVVNVPNASAGKEATCEFTIPEGKSYSSLRFNVTGTTNNRGYWHMAEFQLYPMSLDPKCLNALCADAYKQLAEAIATAEAVEKVSEADVTALQTAYQAYLDALAPITSIGGVSIQPATTIGSAIYDLQGRKVQRMVKGVYIVNGKKVVR